MNISIRLFAVARQLAGCDEITLDLPPGSTVADLRAALRARSPELAPLLKQLLFAVDSEYAPDETILAADSEVACIPPVSGG